MSLNQRRILLAVTGGIAAYKALELTRLLVKEGALVRPLLTESATQFITPLSIQALSGHRPLGDLFDLEQEASFGHIEAARWADLVLVAPATAHSMAKAALGLASDYLGTLILANQAPLAMAPAMNQAMWTNLRTQDHLQRLQDQGVMIWGPEAGELACGESGPGRMLEPGVILRKVQEFFSQPGPLAGVEVLLTAGPTWEPLDEARGLTNHSSGKMGFALAQAFAELGAAVHLVHGPVTLPPPPGVKHYPVTTALEMLEVCTQLAPQASIIVGAAAVADYRPAQPSEEKLPKRPRLQLELLANPDIIASLAAARKPGQVLVGFAAETGNAPAKAAEKRIRKGLDFIVANDVRQSGGVFGQDENQVTLIGPQGAEACPRMSKQELARKIARTLTQALANTRQQTERA